MRARTGGCLCGAVRYEVSGEPTQVGICHCGDCRKESGSAFALIAAWPRDSFKMTGETASYRGRHFCSTCGGRLFFLRETEARIRVGSLDAAPSGLTPTEEVWTIRREEWLNPVAGCEQHETDG
ncbi:GFA family protein [Mesorhizobium sp. RP14(2022)]|uniref:GFA family protein n=1 Tax=Mesorhizobium liriopis TaxID=2953882 RepID=A0ABT1C9X3_9HYPH|nr:GFA family protein [Mesorhizobium liriopis]MCO6050766.1 GFA family protein [Mesorhizobium liriopis]